MPAIPAPKPKPEPQFLEMPIPDTPIRCGMSEEGKRIREMEVSETKCLWFPIPDGKTTRDYRQSLNRKCQHSAEKLGRKYRIYIVKSGVIEGVGIWRVK